MNGVEKINQMSQENLRQDYARREESNTFWSFLTGS